MVRLSVFFLVGACLPLAACAPVAAVKSASLAALERMGLALDSTSRFDAGETLFARAENRDIEIEIEPISKQATRVRVTAKGGSFFYDNATALELVQQTEKLLDAGLAKLTPSVPVQTPAAAGGSKTTF